MKAPIVAVPIVITPAVRTPAMMVGIASGRRTRLRTWPEVMPSAVAASTASGSASLSPVQLFRRMGNTE